MERTRLSKPADPKSRSTWTAAWRTFVFFTARLISALVLYLVSTIFLRFCATIVRGAVDQGEMLGPQWAVGLNPLAWFGPTIVMLRRSRIPGCHLGVVLGATVQFILHAGWWL